MPSELNQDILHIVCGWLAEAKDFNSLYNCARSGKVFAIPAIACLYRNHNKAPGIGAASGDEPLSGRDRNRATDQWATLWRSIILSCLPEQITFDSYAKSIRKLDFEDLQNLLDSQNFKGRISDKFFKGPLSQFKVERTIQVPKSKAKSSYLTLLDAAATANSIAKVVLQETSLLEKLKGTFSSHMIRESLPATKRLQRLRVFEGAVLRGTGSYFYVNCHQFNKIGAYSWYGDEADHDCASFLNELRPQTLRSFCIFGGSRVSLESFLALNSHSSTLTRLELHSIAADSMQHLSNFKDCTNLKSLVLAEDMRPTQDLESRHNDVFLELTEWLEKCKRIKTISITNFINGPALLTPFLRGPGVKIESLDLKGYSMSGNSDFHQALALQKDLTSLYLHGEDSESVSDNSTFVESISRLATLKDLRLQHISANFTDYHICTLARSLPRLETFWTGGFHITDTIWDDIKKLKYLKKFELSADTRFTSGGILDFVTSLEEKTNHGFVLYVGMQDTDCNIPESELEVITDAVSSRLGGDFNFQLVRAPEEMYPSEEDSD